MSSSLRWLASLLLLLLLSSHLWADACSVFLCAGPHNWVEARYFLSRLPH